MFKITIFLISFWFTYSLCASDFDWKELIKIQINSFKTFIDTDYKCCVTKTFHNFFHTQTYFSKKQRHEQLDELLSHLEDDAEELWSAQEIYDFITKNMPPFETEFGSNFKNTCKGILRASCTITDYTCKICYEKNGISEMRIFLNCGHMIACVSCVAAGDTSTCFMCRQITEQIVPISKIKCAHGSDLCHVCNENSPKHICSHCHTLSLCKECKKNTETCSECNNKNTLYEVFCDNDQ